MKKLLASLCLLTALLTLAPSAHAGVLPTQGNYHGRDSHHRTITFSYIGSYIHHFRINHTVGPDAHVSSHGSQWYHTCNAHNLCTKGVWTHDTVVSGSWKNTADHSWTPFTASLIR